jgi:hypothetical protein
MAGNRPALRPGLRGSMSMVSPPVRFRCSPLSMTEFCGLEGVGLGSFPGKNVRRPG